MKIIGITGPTGAGKTTALNALAGLGAAVIDCDEVYHTLLEQSRPMREELTARFGSGILDESEMIDRKKLGAIVFDKPNALSDLNAITHRYVAEEVDRLLAAASAEGKRAAAIDAIALIESGLGSKCDAVVGILAPPEVRIRRIMARESILEEYARLRVSAQKDEAYFRTNCTYILENNEDDTPETFGAKALALFTSILTEE